MHCSITTRSRSRRHVIGALAFGLALSMSPVFPGSGALRAEAPATAVTGLSRG
jgi:hypothetical protein